VSGDKLVAIIGIMMALILVITNSSLRQQPWRAKAWMAGVWLVIIIGAAALFAGFRR
jgi:hypothetical protein